VLTAPQKGISQRNMNYYDFLNEPETQEKIVSSFVAYWTAQVKSKWSSPPASCKFFFSVHRLRDFYT
jgi:D123